MPPHVHYCEAFFGGGAVLLARDPDDSRLFLGSNSSQRGVSELANDLNGRLINFWRVLRDDESFAKFRRTVETIPLARLAWEHAHAHHYGQDPVADAVAFFVDCRQSLAGRQDCFTAITRSRTRRQMNGNVSEWLGAVEGLAAVHARLRRVLIENKPALEIIKREDGPGTLHYIDPPYLPETRAAKQVYAFEMTEGDHRELLDVLSQVRGKVMLSGYPNQLYEEKLKDWNRADFDIANHAAGGGAKRRMVECVWMNYAPAASSAAA
jgi:DNA adenine methylase